MKWYKRDPDAALIGMRELSDIEFRAYSVLIELLYSRDGQVPDDERFMCVHLGWRPQRWRKARASLLAKSKIHLKPDGNLTANRVEAELYEAGLRSDWARFANKKRWKNNKGKHPTPESNPQPQPDIQKASPSVFPRKRGKQKIPLPEIFHPELNGQPEFEHFKDSARQHARLYSDWEAAWRNWQRNAPKFNRNGGNGHGAIQAGGHPRQSDTIEAAAERIKQRLRDRQAPDDALGLSQIGLSQPRGFHAASGGQSFSFSEGDR